MFKLLLFTAIIGLSAASPIELPVKSKHNLETVDTPTQEEKHETQVEIPGGVLPVYLTFKTQSSPIFVKQEHQNTKGSYQKSDSKDEPHRLVHEVTKPVIQELREIVIPYRKVMQVVQPVEEERQTIVHKGERKRYGDDSGSSSNGYGNDNGYGSGSGNGYGSGSGNGYGSGSGSGSGNGYGSDNGGYDNERGYDNDDDNDVYEKSDSEDTYEDNYSEYKKHSDRGGYNYKKYDRSGEIRDTMASAMSGLRRMVIRPPMYDHFRPRFYYMRFI